MKIRSLRPIARPLALAMLTVGVLLLSAQPLAWATPAQLPAGQTVPTRRPGGSGNQTCVPRPPGPPPGLNQPVRGDVGPGQSPTIRNCPWSLAAAGDVFAAGGTLEIKLLLPANAPPPNSGETAIGVDADLTLFDSNGNPLAQPSFAKAALLCYAYSVDELAQAGNDPARLLLQFFDVSTLSWATLPTTPDAAGGQVCAPLTHLTLFAVVAKNSGPAAPPASNSSAQPTAGAANQRAVPPAVVPAALPTTGAPAERGPAAWVWALMALMLGLGSALLWRSRRSIAGQPAAVAAAPQPTPPSGPPEPPAGDQ